MINYNKIAIIGAGNGGRATAAYLKHRGFTINLYFRTFEKIKNLYFTKQLRSEGKLKGIFDIDLVTPEYSQLLEEDVGVIIYVVPANVHGDITRKIAPLLQNNQIILLTPGRTWGAIEVYNILQEMRPDIRVFTGETQTLPFTSRMVGDNAVDIIDIKTQVKYCFYPERYNQRVSTTIFKLFPRLEDVNDIKITSLNNIGAILHPAGLILNAGTVSRRQDLYFYSEGMTKDIVKVIESADKERCAIMEKLGVKAESFTQWASTVYRVKELTYYQTFQKIRSYQNIYAPKKLNIRYLTEDVPTGLVPLASLGELIGVATTTITSLINLANTLLETDFREKGRTLKNVKLPQDILSPEVLSEHRPKIQFSSPEDSQMHFENQETR
jgi:opine dehydrogenase